jgi:hypothetical protein
MIIRQTENNERIGNPRGIPPHRLSHASRDKTPMINISRCALFFMILFLGGASASAQITKPFVPNCDIDHIDSLVGTVAMSLGIERVVLPTMKCLLKLWREDQGGTTQYYESRAFLAIMDQNPQLFFASMANEPKIFNEWLNRLGADSFTWPFDPPCELEKRREQLILMLRRVEVRPSNLMLLKDLTIKKLATIRCRQID